MRFYSLVALVGAALAAYSDPEMAGIVASKSRANVLRVTDENWQKILYGDRDFNLVVFLTLTSPQLDCVLCREAKSPYLAIASSYAHAFPDGIEGGTNTYFADAEYVELKNLFAQLGVDSIPKLYFFPKTKPDVAPGTFVDKYEQYPFYQGDHLTLMMQWVTSKTGKSFDIVTPPDYGRMFMNAAVTFALVMVLRRFSSHVTAGLRSPVLWGVGLVFLILLFSAGYMFNQIRQTPYIRDNGREVEYFAPSPQLQYGLETQVVLTLYGLLGVTFVLLATKVPAIGNTKVRFGAVVIVTLVLYLVYSIFMSVFAHKYRGYPYLLWNFLPSP